MHTHKFIVLCISLFTTTYYYSQEHALSSRENIPQRRFSFSPDCRRSFGPLVRPRSACTYLDVFFFVSFFSRSSVAARHCCCPRSFQVQLYAYCRIEGMAGRMVMETDSTRRLTSLRLLRCERQASKRTRNRRMGPRRRH